MLCGLLYAVRIVKMIISGSALARATHGQPRKTESEGLRSTALTSAALLRIELDNSS